MASGCSGVLRVDVESEDGKVLKVVAWIGYPLPGEAPTAQLWCQRGPKFVD